MLSFALISIVTFWVNTSYFVIRGKAKRKIHAGYPFLGGGTYQPPVLSVSYLQVGY